MVTLHLPEVNKQVYLVDISPIKGIKVQAIHLVQPLLLPVDVSGISKAQLSKVQLSQGTKEQTISPIRSSRINRTSSTIK